MPNPQGGILDRPPEHLLVASLNLLTTTPADVQASIVRLRGLVQHESLSQLDSTTPQSPKDQPSAETGELGFTDDYDRYKLTITVGFAKAAYDKLGVPAAQQPQDLVPIPWDKLGDQVADGSRAVTRPANGDVLVQVCSDSVYVNEHVLRRIEHALAADFAVAWTLQGSQRHTTRAGSTSRSEGRALTGFLDGTSNLDPRHLFDDRKLVFVDPDDVREYPRSPDPATPTTSPNPYNQSTPPTFPGDLRQPPQTEPDWTEGGTYAVVRGSVVDIPRWDTQPLGSQEHVIGRFKVSGSALDHPDDPTQPPAEPNFQADPQAQTTPLSAHIRKANPRSTPDDAERRIFRRGYPLVLADVDGLKRGLVFVCFGRTISSQFEFITRAWTTNLNFPVPGAGVDAFRAFESAVLAGGYFFIPPLDDPTQSWSWHVPVSVPAA